MVVTRAILVYFDLSVEMQLSVFKVLGRWNNKDIKPPIFTRVLVVTRLSAILVHFDVSVEMQLSAFKVLGRWNNKDIKPPIYTRVLLVTRLSAIPCSF